MACAPDDRISVVTGGSGFVGQALVRRLCAAGDTVRAIVLPGDLLIAELRAAVPADARLEIVEANVCDRGALVSAFAGAERVFHTAAIVHAWASRAAYRRVNVEGTRNVAHAALEQGVGRLVVLSTSDVFGLPRGARPMDEDSELRPWGEPYADSKIEAERWLRAYREETGLAVTSIYPGWVYGPGDRSFFPGLARAIESGLLFSWFRGVRLAWVYIDNLVDACLLASRCPAADARGYLVFDGMDGPTLDDVCARIAAVLGARPPRRRLPYTLAYAIAALLQGLWRVGGRSTEPPLRTADVKAFGLQWKLSNRRARAELGWSPRVGFDEGMQRALDFLLDRWKKSTPPSSGG